MLTPPSYRFVGSQTIIFGETFRSHLNEIELDVRWQIAYMATFTILPMAGITNQSSLPLPSFQSYLLSPDYCISFTSGLCLHSRLPPKSYSIYQGYVHLP